MLTRERTSKTRTLKYVAAVLALLSVLVFCFASCGADAAPTAVNYVDGSAAKVEYNQGETFDCTGAKIEVTYNDGTKLQKDVTTDMVGSAPLALGVTNVSVTYSENGTTVIGYIPVTVKDPYAAQKVTAVGTLDAAAEANKADKGIALLVANYKEKIQAANSVDAINTVVANFNDALASYKADKAAVLAAMDNDEMQLLYAQLYAQFKTGVESLKAIAVSSINAANGKAEAEAILADFKAAVNNALAEQKVYEGENKDPDAGIVGGQIGDKIAILTLIEEYTERLNVLVSLVEIAYWSDEIDIDKYTEMVYGDATTGFDYVAGRLSWWEKYIYLAIDLTDVEAKIRNEVGTLLRTPVDDMADYLAGENGHTVVPVEYKDENGAWVDGVDATQAIIDKIDALAAKTVENYGETGLEALIREYGPLDLAKTPYIVQIYTDIKAKQAELKTIRDDAKAIVDLIEDAVAATDTKRAAVDVAWAALKTWGATYDVVDVDTTKDYIDKYLDFTGKDIADVILKAVIVDDANSAENGFLRGGHVIVEGDNTTYEFWADDAFTKAYVIKYFVPNLEDLIEATTEQASIEAKAVVNAIKEVLISYTNADVDANASITAAEKALDDYKALYGEANYKKYFEVDGVDEFAAKVTTARAAYKNLQDLAKAANDAIELYKDLIENNVENIETKDYEAETLNAESGAKLLKDAYVKYLTFASANTAKTGDNIGTIYTDVIENSDATTVTGNETNLLAYMTKYINLAYIEQRVVKTNYIISTASNARVDSIAVAETAFREAVTKYAVQEIKRIISDPAFALNTDNLDKFNYDAVLADNLAKVITEANTVATFIKDESKTAADFLAELN